MTEQPWPLRRLRPDLAWPLSQGAGVTVAVIDSGVAADHPVLSGQVFSGVDFLRPDFAGVCDLAAHGSIIAGVIAGRQLPNSGFSGIAPQAKILPIRVVADTERTNDPAVPGNIATAIRLAADAPNVAVINLSLYTVQTPALDAAIAYAIAKNVVIVAAAGNQGGEGGNQAAYPAAHESVIAVAGIDELDRHVEASTAGAYVDVAAPGVRVAGPMPVGGGFESFKEGGTSFAAAYVSGVAALIKSRYPGLSPGQVARRIVDTADHPPSGWNPDVGHGVVNPYRAVAADVPEAQPVPLNTELPAPAAKRDPLAGARTAAIWSAAGGVALTVIVLVGAFVVRAGRRRGWRPERARSG